MFAVAPQARGHGIESRALDGDALEVLEASGERRERAVGAQAENHIVRVAFLDIAASIVLATAAFSLVIIVVIVTASHEALRGDEDQRPILGHSNPVWVLQARREKRPRSSRLEPPELAAPLLDD
jgi:hypothetical protein